MTDPHNVTTRCYTCQVPGVGSLAALEYLGWYLGDNDLCPYCTAATRSGGGGQREEHW